jgi:hypothetical protein
VGELPNHQQYARLGGEPYQEQLQEGLLEQLQNVLELLENRIRLELVLVSTSGEE